MSPETKSPQDNPQVNSSVQPVAQPVSPSVTPPALSPPTAVVSGVQPTIGQNAQPPTTNQPGSRPKKLLVTGAVILLAIVAVGAFWYITLNKRFTMNGTSMSPTIKNGQKVTLAPETDKPVIGQIVLFDEPGLKSDPTSMTQLIRRVVAVEGDRIQISNGIVTVLNSAHPKGYDPDNSYGLGSLTTSAPVGTIDLTIHTGYIYVLSDNRSQTVDSRTFGPVLISNITGHVTHIY